MELMRMDIAIDNLSVMGGSFEARFRHSIRADGNITYTVYNAQGLQLKREEMEKSPEEVSAFFEKALGQTGMLSWKEKYYSDACGGFRWQVDLAFDGGETRSFHGYIRLPENWEKLAALVDTLTGRRLYVTGSD